MKHLLMLTCLCSLSFGETVTWTATGKVTTAGGVFGGAGISVDDAVSVEFSYNSVATARGIKEIAFFGTLWEDFHGGVELMMKVTIGDRTWSGSVQDGIDSGIQPYTLYVQREAQASNEKVIPALDEEDGASFLDFPLSEGGGNDVINLNFSATGNEFVGGPGITASAFDASKITSASGSIATGTEALLSQLDFSIDPTSVMIVSEEVERPVVDLSLSGEDVTLSWDSELNVTYEIQTNTGLSEAGWMPFFSVSGTGETIIQTFSKTLTSEFYRVVIP